MTTGPDQEGRQASGNEKPGPGAWGGKVGEFRSQTYHCPKTLNNKLTGMPEQRQQARVLPSCLPEVFHSVLGVSYGRHLWR